MEIINGLSNLFKEHTPETLLALFGAATSLLMFSLVWYMLRHDYEMEERTSDQETGQDQTTTALVESLVRAVLSEAEHLRQVLSGILQEALDQTEQNTNTLDGLMTKTDKTPAEVLQLLKPEFEHLHQEICQTESRIIAKIEIVVRPADIQEQR